jgi:hypothetical protein
LGYGKADFAGISGKICKEKGLLVMDRKLALTFSTEEVVFVINNCFSNFGSETDHTESVFYISEN